MSDGDLIHAAWADYECSLPQPRIVATEYSPFDGCWLYKLENGLIVRGDPGEARVPAGLPWNERSRWGANRVFGR